MKRRREIQRPKVQTLRHSHVWRRVGRRHEEEEPAKKQKWLEWWRVPWLETEAQRQGGHSHQCASSQRHRERLAGRESNPVSFS